MRWLKWVGIVLVVLVIALGAAYGGLMIASNNALNQTYDIPEIAAIDLPTDAESLIEGQRLYTTRGCGDCHGEDGGGAVVFDVPALGYTAGSNLTAGEGGVGSTFTIEDYIRAIRHGVDPDGKAYILMPSHDYSHFTNADMAQIIAYVQSLEPVDQNMGESYLGPVGRIIMMTSPEAGVVPAMLIDHASAGPTDVEVAVSVEYGAYVIRTCTGCHGSNLTGGPMPGSEPDAPAPSNLTPHETGLDGWTLEQFTAALRTGERPNGEQINAAYMPWPSFSQFTNVEIEAMYMYLQSIDPLPYDTDA